MLNRNDLLAAVQNLPSLTEKQELLQELQKEVEKCFEIAHKLDVKNPTLQGAFTGTPSERIERQLIALEVLK